MATSRKHTDRDIMKLVLESNSDAYSLEDKDISAQSDSDTHDVTNKIFTQWTDNTNY
jgi:hypothetical protein